MSSNKTDVELVQEFRAGSQASFEELIQRYSAKAFSLASRLTRNPQDAEEVLQDVFVTVYRKIDGFQGKSSFSSWLYRITVNSALMKLRRKRRDQTVPMEDLLPQVQNTINFRAAEHGEGDAMTWRHQLTEALEDAIARLPDDYRPVFVLRDIDGLTSREVSRILKLSVPAVKSRLHRSRLMLRRRLKGMYRELHAGGSTRSVGNW